MMDETNVVDKADAVDETNAVDKTDAVDETNMIELDHVTKEYGSDVILNNVSLKLRDNRIYGFVGHNGSGKTVLFKIISGYLKADSGDVSIRGKKLGKNYDFPDNIGVLIEKPGFMWHESAYKNLAYLASIKNTITKDEIKESIRQVGLDPESKKHVGKYSLGMKQRLGIAQAIMEEPDILILDEPMNALDEDGVDLVRKLIAEYKREGRVILLASHNREDIEMLCDEVYKVSKGKLEKLE